MPQMLEKVENRNKFKISKNIVLLGKCFLVSPYELPVPRHCNLNLFHLSREHGANWVIGAPHHGENTLDYFHKSLKGVL